MGNKGKAPLMWTIQVYVFGYKKDHFRTILQSGLLPKQKDEKKENAVKTEF
jgi:hypothetical protein